jgi:hypothetical protein
LSSVRNHPGSRAIHALLQLRAPYHGEKQLSAELVFAAGKLWLGAGASDGSTRWRCNTMRTAFSRSGSYEAGQVRLGVEGNGQGGIRVGSRSALPQTARIDFPATIDLSLDVSLGAAEADLALGGLRLAALALKSGASRATVGFAKPNPGTCRSAEVSSARASSRSCSSGNSGCPLGSFPRGGLGDHRSWTATGARTGGSRCAWRWAR